MLGFWSWSLVQFVLVVTGTTKARTKMTEIFGSQGGSPVMVSQSESGIKSVGETFNRDLARHRLTSFFEIKMKISCVTCTCAG